VIDIGEDEVHVWLVPLEQPDHVKEEMESFLDDGERERRGRYVHDVHRDRFCVGRGLLRILLGDYTGRSPEQVRFSYGENGKPVLADGPAMAFNMSHSGAWGLLGVTRAAAVGVDIEAIRSVPEFEDIARAHFAPGEVDALTRLPGDRRQDGFFACWTRKEAFVKMTGEGLAMALDQFEVSVDPDGPAALRSVRGSVTDAQACALWSFRPVPGFWGAVAAQGRDLVMRQFRLDLNSRGY
jgi:4'-phosphopantetheinyl transferase